MKTHHYQFSFNLGQAPVHLKQQSVISLLFNDIFPYYRARSLTCGLQLASILPFTFSILTSTLQPFSLAQSNNIFLIICSYIIKSFLFLRLGSQYENHFGLKYFATIMIGIEITHLSGLFLIGLFSWSSVFDGTSILSLYILAFADIKNFRMTQLEQYQPEQKVVQNYDLLDLNDTIIKLKNKENSFIYESYTNKQFYIHNVTSKKQSKKSMLKSSKKSKNISSIVDQSLNTNDIEPFEAKLLKFIFYQFIVYVNVPFHHFAIMVIAQAQIYFAVSTKVIKKIL